MNRDILALIHENMDTFSKGQKRIANYILESYDKAAFMTASKLGKRVNVSESTVVRFAAELGHDGYPSMQPVSYTHLCVDFPCNTQSIAASNRLVWRKNPSPSGTFPIFKQVLAFPFQRGTSLWAH